MTIDPVRDLVSGEVFGMIYSVIKRTYANTVSFRISNGVDITSIFHYLCSYGYPYNC